MTAEGAAGDQRCPLCLNPRFHARPHAFKECTHCEVAFAPEWTGQPEAARAALLAHAKGAALAEGLALNAAARRNLAFALARDAAGHVPVTLAAIARTAELAQFLHATEPVAGLFAERVVLVDAEQPPPVARNRVRVLAKPFDGDFAAQRNRLMAEIHTDWVLQLDTDESLTGESARTLVALVSEAERLGLAALGLPRRNRVDGVLSSLYPDIQYRLLHRDIRFAGRVHERPVVPFARTALALACPIDHALSRARVVARTAQYGAMAADAARPEDETALLQPMPARWRQFL
ncbi:hypothetical protein GRI62_04415 [Erythrobacter arachoides]|uniref:Glycosyltransferase n=1 Tax=Aurantiacibacter arachoides TaxID=1850444 RepID=A0A844ZX32_9SPHN|nr:hypothetical protein [Aurantiacibacter arachoides]MXO92851.1 hypothetical protein [Aurantiacibacter arachoides]GGD53977.1 hypothetical protein GCM10011411_12350 [Aurantiacibacter arachoides]